MKKLLALLCTLCLLAGLLPVLATAEDNVVYVYNWYDYIDEDVLALFEEETGIHVEYTCFTTNEIMIADLAVSPDAFDVVFPSDYIVERMVANNMLAPLDWDQLPNAKANILPHLLNPDYDPEGLYSVPYMWGTLGILYNPAMVDGEVDSWGILFDEKYAGSVFMLDSIRDTMGLALAYLGYDINAMDDAALAAARDLLIAQKQSGIVRAYQVDQIKDRMVAGEAALSVVWSGDAEYAIEMGEEQGIELCYVIPWEGSNIWVDPMVVPKNAPHYENAMRFIDFLCRPDIAQMNCEEIGYCSPNAGAIELMGEDYQANPVLNPEQDYVDVCEYFHDIPADQLERYNRYWDEVKNAH